MLRRLGIDQNRSVGDSDIVLSVLSFLAVKVYERGGEEGMRCVV